ncbi:hypothetical protein ACQKOF_12975 [Lysinibacillus sp. NPDC093190]|uniref:hypothetical protein n=1 Tax=Lysinibacillus sp. NPDC093190 TaxID=3390575 RepID=UPI003D01478D
MVRTTDKAAKATDRAFRTTDRIVEATESMVRAMDKTAKATDRMIRVKNYETIYVDCVLSVIQQAGLF